MKTLCSQDNCILKCIITQLDTIKDLKKKCKSDQDTKPGKTGRLGVYFQITKAKRYLKVSHFKHLTTKGLLMHTMHCANTQNQTALYGNVPANIERENQKLKIDASTKLASFVLLTFF